MKDYPIIFNAEMVRAILRNQKRMTRRVIKPQPEWVKDMVMLWKGSVGIIHAHKCPYHVEQHLWVRESYVTHTGNRGRYKADGEWFGVPQGKRLNRTPQAWGDALVLWEAMKRADKAGDLTGPGIMKKGFETMRNYDIGLGAAPLTYTATDHRPGTGCIVQEWKNGKFQEVANIDLKKRWPDKWEKEWLGW